MRLSVKAFITANLFLSTGVEASFLRDVVRGQEKIKKQNAIETDLLAKAVPIAEYRQKIREQGLDIPVPTRRLEDGNDEGDDDYYMNANYMYDLSGYSLKYAKCQPVQRFSTDAIEGGEYSPMVTDDIVILRLCPNKFCSASRAFGCTNHYAEYAVDLSDYTRIMLRYKMAREEQLCEWCDGCSARRRHLEDGADADGNDADEEQAEEEQAGDDANGDDGQEQQDDQGAGDDENNQWWNYGGDDNADDDGNNDPCNDYESYCYDENGGSLCDDGNGDDAYLDLEEYLDYTSCTQVKDDDAYSYYVRPRCDGSSQTIKMAIYHDQFCSQYAGNEVNIKNFGLGFTESAFEEFYYETPCLDCSTSYYPPYFYANGNMCNRMHVSGAKCTTQLQYDLFGEDNSNQATECAFIESVRYGTYDESGALLDSKYLYGVNHNVTDGQKVGLVLTLLLCAILATYSCYLHHSITNLLIKSLSHTDLLPPSRQKRSHGNQKTGRNRRGRKTRVAADDDEWVDVKGTIA